MPNNNSNNGSRGSKGPKKFTTTPPAGAVSPVGLRFSSNSNYGNNNLSTVPGNGNSNGGELNALSEYNGQGSEEEFGGYGPTAAPPGTPAGVLNNLSVWSNNNGTATTWSNNGSSNNGSSNNGSSNNGIPAYMTTNRISRNNQLPRLTAKNMGEYPPLGGRIFSNSKTPKKPGKRNNGKNRKSRKVKNTRKNRK